MFKHLLRTSVPALFMLASTPLWSAQQLELALTTVEGTGDAAMIVSWIETTDGKFVRTLLMFSKDKKYYKDMTIWQKGRGEAGEGDVVDAMISPTIKWSANRTVAVNVVQGDLNLLSGKYVLRVEQRKDKAGHYKKTRIPLTADFSGVKLQDEGYLASLSVTLKKG